MPSAMFLAGPGRQFVRGRVLDAGCGRKPYKRLFPECEWVGLDKRPVGELSADLHEMPEVESDSFDTVVCTEVLHECVSPMTVMKELARVLKPGGFLLVTAPNCFAEDGEAIWGVKVRGMDFL